MFSLKSLEYGLNNMYCDICSEPLSSIANGGRCDTCRIEFTGRMVDVILRLKHKWYKRIAEQQAKIDSKNKSNKIIKLHGHCYDGTGWNECPFWNRHPKNHRCMLFGKDGIPKNASHSLVICNRIYGETYEGDV